MYRLSIAVQCQKKIYNLSDSDTQMLEDLITLDRAQKVFGHMGMIEEAAKMKKMYNTLFLKSPIIVLLALFRHFSQELALELDGSSL